MRPLYETESNALLKSRYAMSTWPDLCKRKRKRKDLLTGYSTYFLLRTPSSITLYYLRWKSKFSQPTYKETVATVKEIQQYITCRVWSRMYKYCGATDIPLPVPSGFSAVWCVPGNQIYPHHRCRGFASSCCLSRCMPHFAQRQHWNRTCSQMTLIEKGYTVRVSDTCWNRTHSQSDTWGIRTYCTVSDTNWKKTQSDWHLLKQDTQLEWHLLSHLANIAYHYMINQFSQHLRLNNTQ